MAEIEPLLTGPSWSGVHMLWLDLRWDPIRDDSRFQALLEEHRNQSVDHRARALR